MKQPVWILTLLLSICASAAAQDRPSSECPEISIIGPAGIVEPGQTGLYTAKVDMRGKRYSPEYQWTVTHGRIVRGQATTQVEVVQDRSEDGNLTVTLEVRGFPSGCQNTASESLAIAPRATVKKVEPSPAPQNCPTLEVTGPSGVTAPGAIMPFAVIVSDPSLKKLSFEWRVSAGTIVEGQGSRVLKVQAPVHSGGMNVTATVTVNGLPTGCVNSASDTAGAAQVLEGDPVDQYGKLPINDEYARLQSGVIAARNNPNSLLVVIKRLPRIGAVELSRIKKLREFIIVSLQFPASRFRLIPTISTREETTIWLVPPGAKMPT
jgi:hypothetical protein